MQYRDFGSTGKKISALGFGCMRLPEIERDGKPAVDEEKAIPMLRRGYELGINYFDTAVGYCHQNSQYTVGRALKPIRDKVMLSTKIPMRMVREQADYRRILEESLRRLDTDYIDFYHFHGINRREFDDIITPMHLIGEAVKAKEEGLIRHISFSFHDKPENMKYIIDRGEVFSSVLCQYNILDRSNEQVMQYAREKGLGVVIMGPVGGGRLGAPSDMYRRLMGRESMATPELAMRFVLSNQSVCCALSGMQNIDMLEQNAAIASLEEPMTEEDHRRAALMMEEIKKFSDLYCTGCQYCMPCPKGIDIPKIFNIYNMHNVYGLTQYAKSMYASVGDPKVSAAVSACVKCRKCVEKCPQHISIPEELERIGKLFETL